MTSMTSESTVQVDALFGKESHAVPNRPTLLSKMQATRKRKSTEINTVLALVDDPELENPNERATLQRSDDVFFDMKPRWRRAFMQELHRETTKDGNNDMVLLCPDESCKSPEVLILEIGDTTRPRLPTISETSLPAIVKSPTFRLPSAKESSGLSSQKESPTGVDAFQRGRIHFWQRSMAWSEDWSTDDEIVDVEDEEHEHADADADADSAIRLHLSVPTDLGHKQSSVPAINSLWRPLAQSSEYRHRLATSRISARETDVDNTTEIHWEEQICDVFDLEKMARLCLSD